MLEGSLPASILKRKNLVGRNRKQKQRDLSDDAKLRAMQCSRCSESIVILHLGEEGGSIPTLRDGIKAGTRKRKVNKRPLKPKLDRV